MISTRMVREKRPPLLRAVFVLPKDPEMAFLRPIGMRGCCFAHLPVVKTCARFVLHPRPKLSKIV